MAKVELTLKVRIAWWFYLYLNTLRLLCCITGCEPNMGRVEFWMRKAIRVTPA